MLTIGIDIGGTKIAAGLVDENGKILKIEKQKTDPKNIENINETIIELTHKLAQGHEITNLGISITGFIADTRDIILFGTNIEHENYNLKAALQKQLPYNIIIENDANAASWAEYKYGKGKGYNSMAMITLGTGLGGAIILNNTLIRGNHGKAGEIGHIKIVPNGIPCSCGLKGCWEAYASGTALVRNANLLYKSDPKRMQTILSHSENNQITGIAITKAAQNGDETAKQLLAELGWWVGYGASNLVATVDPQLIVIGGGVSEAQELILPHIKRGYYENLSAGAYTESAKIVLASSQNDAGIIGAADLARL